MRRARLSTVVLAASLIAWFSGSIRGSVTIGASAQSRKRVVDMSITVPKQGVPPLRLAADEGDTATLSVDGLGTFGFVPTFRQNNASTVIVTVFDVARSPSQRLGDTEVPLAGERVQSKTSPSFGIQVIRVTQRK